MKTPPIATSQGGKKTPIHDKGVFSEIMPEKKVALIYCRVSTKKQNTERFWLETQVQMCTDRCNKNNIVIGKTITDGWVSWGTFQREGFDEVMEILDKQHKKLSRESKKKNKEVIAKIDGNPVFTHFVCVDNSRISRNDDMAETLFMTNKIRGAGLEISYILYPIDANSSAGMLQENIMYAFAAFERRNTRAKAMNGLRARLLEGYRPFGRSPIGYLRERQWKHSVMVIDQLKWPIIKEAMEMYASWVLESEGAVYRYMRDKGLKTNNSQNTKGVLHKTIVETLFWQSRLYFYAGFITKPDWGIDELIPAKHEPLISLETVKKIFERRNQSPYIGKYKLQHNPDFPLKDFILCGHCGKRMCGYRSKGRTKKYPYYACPNKKDPDRFIEKRDLMHEKFDLFLDTFKMHENVREYLELMINRLRKQRWEFEGKLLEDKQSALEEATARMKKIRVAMLSTSNSHLMEEFEWEREMARVEKERLKKELDDKKMISEDELNELLVLAKKIFSDPKMVWEMSNIELKKMLVHVMFGDELFYTKEKSYHTTWNALYHLVNQAVKHPSFLV